MSSAVLTAIIGVAGTLLGACAGFGASVWATKQTVDAAREARLRDQRSEVYVEAIASIGVRQIKRDMEMRKDSLAPADQQRLQAYVDTYEQPDPHLMEARLTAFGSSKAHSLIQQSSKAEVKARACFEALKQTLPGSEAEKQALEAWQRQREATDDADHAAIEQMRSELQGSGLPLGTFEIVPADEAW